MGRSRTRKPGNRPGPATSLRHPVRRLAEQVELVEQQAECIKCAACCRALFIFVTAEDLAREPRLDKVVSRIKNRPQDQPIFGEYSDKYLLAAGWAIPCPMLGPDRRCTIYPTRPNACRQWQPNLQSCRDLRKKLAANANKSPRPQS